jgi:butyrate kinase
MKEIKGIARVKFLPGKLEEWKHLTTEAMRVVRGKE